METEAKPKVRIIKSLCPTCLYATKKYRWMNGRGLVKVFEDPDQKRVWVLPRKQPIMISFALAVEGVVEAFEEKGRYHVHIVTGDKG